MAKRCAGYLGCTPLIWKLLLFFVIFLPCSSRAFWPIYWEFGDEKRFFGPLISYEEQKDNTRLTLRPLLSSYDSENGGVYNYLYPLGYSSRQRSYFIPFYLSNHSDKEPNTALFPFFGGTSEKQGGYGGIFPFYGRLYDRFGKDEMGFFMWPLYSYTESEGAKKQNFLWPIFAFYSGTDSGFKAWPLFGTRERKGERKSTFFLWPFVFKEEKNLDTDDPINNLYVIPFYLRSEAKTQQAEAIMWPIYYYRKNPDREKWDIIWPFFSYTKGEKEGGYNIFPFILTEHKERDKKFSILWPFLYNSSTWYVRDQEYFRMSFLLLNRYIKDDDGTFTSVWPFFERTDKGEDSHTMSPTVLPIKWSGFTRIVKPLFAIIENKRDSKRNMTSLLYGLYTQEENGDDWKARFAFLFEIKQESGKIGFEILSGLFGIDEKRVKVFFIPFKRGGPESGEE